MQLPEYDTCGKSSHTERKISSVATTAILTRQPGYILKCWRRHRLQPARLARLALLAVHCRHSENFLQTLSIQFVGGKFTSVGGGHVLVRTEFSPQWMSRGGNLGKEDCLRAPNSCLLKMWKGLKKSNEHQKILREKESFSGAQKPLEVLMIHKKTDKISHGIRKYENIPQEL